jgi:anti-sigma factor RsiW
MTEHPLDELAVYALDALDDDDERRAVEAHLAECPTCTAEVAAHRATLAGLTVDELPPPAIWQRVARDIGVEDLPAPLPVTPSVPSRPTGDAEAPMRPSHLRRRRPRDSRSIALAAAGLAAAVAVVVGGVAVMRSDGEPADLAALANEALEAPGAQVATLSTEGGERAARVVVDGPTGYVLVDELPTLPSGQEYQLWKVAGGVPVSLGVIGDGSTPVAAVGVPANTADLAISTEPAGGSVAPTGTIVATGALTA